MSRINFECNEPVACFSNKFNRPLKLDGIFTFTYDYPLTRIAKFEHRLRPRMTRFDVLELASADYKRIYREEDADVGEPTKHIPGMLNREESEGRYGIWGHDIDDLVFEEVRIDTEKKTVRFGIGS